MAQLGRNNKKILASDGAADDQFGGSIAAHEGTFIVGASKDDDKGSDSGSAYIFTMPYLETAAVRDEPRWHTNIDFDVSGDLHFTGELYEW